jgi:DNA-binding response OmpR family regulator
MEVTNSENRLLVLHKNTRISSAIDEIMLYNRSDTTWLSNLNKTGSIKPDLVLMDCQLLDNDCVLICRDVRADDRLLKNTPIIIATAYKSKKASHGQSHDDAFLAKRQDVRKLFSNIKNTLKSFGSIYLAMNASEIDA